MTPELLTRFAALLDIPGGGLTALTGIKLTTLDPPVRPDAAEAALLLWDARELTRDQLSLVRDRGRERGPSPAGG